uniref:Uncharacterized protein n=1 Tax=Eutreptiella gymnastica TaxID=73025 RepID=A0A7S1I0D8_9EUGL|mmetsp:Transcript_118582/g.206528  ORF Transcript_118582/g.206528 Transcript_118582/m.206528 type:complete len:177 (+) Transcript_118582:109-639(+)
MCIVLPVREGADPLVHLQPASLDAEWALKWQPSMHSPGCCTKDYLATLFLGVMQGNLSMVRTWGGLLMSACAWMQVAALSGYSRQAITGAMVIAAGRACACMAHDLTRTERFIAWIAFRMPLSRSATAQAVYEWLGRNAFWDGDAYSSWHCPHRKAQEHNEFCGMWDGDADCLLIQ